MTVVIDIYQQVCFRPSKVVRNLIVFTVSFLWLTLAHASTIQLSIAKWQFDDLDASGLKFEIAVDSEGLALIAKAETITLPEPLNKINNVVLYCHNIELLAAQSSCKKGELNFHHKTLGQQRLRFKIIAKSEQQYYQIQIKDLNIDSTKLDVDIELKKDRWYLALVTNETSYDSLHRIASHFLSQQKLSLLTQWQFTGNIAINSYIYGVGSRLNKLQLDLALNDMTGGDSEGNFVTEAATSLINIDALNKSGIWQWQAAMQLTVGQGYGDPIFIDFSENPIDINGIGTWKPETNRFEVSKLDFKHKNVLQGQAQIVMQSNVLASLDVNIEQTAIAPFYENWLQPFFVGTAADTVSLEGEVEVNFQKKIDNYFIDLSFDNVKIDDENKRFGLNGFNGKVAWTSFASPVQSDIKWQSAYLYAIPIGETRFKAKVADSKLSLLAPLTVPVLDGELQVESLNLENNDKKTEWAFEGLLTPISMESLSSVLEWPLLHGKLSGVIPQLSYKNQQINVDGALMVKLFEGTSIIRDLRLTKPFGSLPQLYANIDLLNMDLETLTETFEFGKITGKLDGKINNLRLSNWHPVQFDAHFLSSEKNKTKKRISQQAVNNLSQVGGGAGGVLSRSFLRFFEDFSYQRLGLSCKLRNEVCQMSGVGEIKGGYYIVRGGGLPPRINVIGHTRRVNWPELIARLKAVSNSSGPVVR